MVVYRSPGIRIDEDCLNRLEGWLDAAAIETHEAGHQDGGGPFNGYERSLTHSGGIQIVYRDLNRGLLCKCLRMLAFGTVSLFGLWMTFPILNLSGKPMFAGLTALALVDLLIVRFKIKASHSVEIRPDCMIIDGEDIFWAEDIGDNWPELKPDEEDPTKMSIAGICGTRLIEYMTANRIDENDRTPEVLMAHLHEAMEQMWGRREVTFAPAP
ncbi:hypothetical protein ACWAT4_36990 [Bradyrhizobium manausense]